MERHNGPNQTDYWSNIIQKKSISWPVLLNGDSTFFFTPLALDEFGLFHPPY
jgi:hypothetical protein